MKMHPKYFTSMQECQEIKHTIIRMSNDRWSGDDVMKFGIKVYVGQVGG